jgi:hypothetical protein
MRYTALSLARFASTFRELTPFGHGIENPRVGGSIPSSDTTFVERNATPEVVRSVRFLAFRGQRVKGLKRADVELDVDALRAALVDVDALRGALPPRCSPLRSRQMASGDSRRCSRAMLGRPSSIESWTASRSPRWEGQRVGRVSPRGHAAAALRPAASSSSVIERVACRRSPPPPWRAQRRKSTAEGELRGAGRSCSRSQGARASRRGTGLR